MELRPGRSARQGILPYQIEEPGSGAQLTSYAGLPLVAETYRALGLDRAVAQHVRLKTRARGLPEAQMVESFCLLLAAGGECLEDFAVLRADGGLAEMVGHALPSPEAARQFLYRFHDDTVDTRREEHQAQTGEASYVPAETAALRGLFEVNRTLVARVQQPRPKGEATLDVDATLIESAKEEAYPTYAGGCGYQPTTVWWAEQGLVVADEFRDGNVPAGKDLRRVIQRAVEALPAGVTVVRLRADSAAYTQEVLRYCREERDGRPRIEFAISADMSPALRAEIEALPGDAWRPLSEDAHVRREWAEVAFVPEERSPKKDTKPDRYLAIRLTKRQGELFADGQAVRHFAVVTNRWEMDGGELIEWHRGKAGTIEHVHDVLKNELGAGVMPCGRFGANAAWFRLAVLTLNLLQALKVVGLGEQLRTARPKRLRFLVFNVAAELIHHARSLIVRLGRRWLEGPSLIPVRASLLLLFSG